MFMIAKCKMKMPVVLYVMANIEEKEVKKWNKAKRV